MATQRKAKRESSLDLDLDAQMNALESEWRQVYEASLATRAEYVALQAEPSIPARQLESARQRVARAEALKARIMAKIERLEESLQR